MIPFLKVPFLASSPSLFDLLRQGGWAMFPLAGLSFALFLLLLMAWLLTSNAYFGFQPSRWIRDPLTPKLQERLRQRAARSSHAEALDFILQSTENNTLRWIQYLNVIATVAPMVGLLGTVSGMIGAFQTIATGGMGKPELLAGDIGQALITTATGLTIGIPAMIFYFVLRNRLDNRLEELEDTLLTEHASPDKTTATAPPAYRKDYSSTSSDSEEVAVATSGNSNRSRKSSARKLHIEAPSN